jgi:sugar lactone lactonase YvrE
VLGSIALVALALLAFAPGAGAFETRTPLGSFGPAGGGPCDGYALATGSGDIPAPAATGTGSFSSGSTTVSNVTTSSGAFAVGQSIFAIGAANSAQTAPSTTITAVGANALTLSTPATGNLSGNIYAGSAEISDVSTDCGTFAAGQVIEGSGISEQARPKIASVGAGTLTLDRVPPDSAADASLAATSRFGNAHSLAFQQASGRLYLLDKSAEEIHAFSTPALTPAGGGFPLAVDDTGGIEQPDIAVDNTLGASAGNSYYASPGAGAELFGLDPTGAPLGGAFPIKSLQFQSGVAVDSGGNIWVSDASTNQAVHKFTAAGAFVFQRSISQGTPRDLAFDSNDNLYLVVSSSAPNVSGVWRLTAASDYKSADQLVSFGMVGQGSIAIDRSSDTVYAVHNLTVGAYDISGNFLYGFGFAGEPAYGVAIDESADRVYVTAEGRKVRVFGAQAEFPDATVTPQSATNITTTSAELHATIADNSALPTRARFQVSKDEGATWQNTGVGATTAGGQSAVAFSATATGLQSGTDYLFRVVTNKGGGSEPAASATEAFQTVALPPASAVCAQAAQNVTDSSADLTCVLDDDNEFPTFWHFQVSKDGGGTWADTGVSGKTVGNEAGVVVSGTATGLDPNSEYVLRLATSKGPGSVQTFFDGPAPFTTVAVPPLVADVGAAAITDTSMYLVGEVDARFSPTSYVFEYGPTVALGQVADPVDIGAGGEPVVVSQQIAGLPVGAPLHFKLVATNGAGSTESAVQIATTRPEPLPNPDDRAYEQVTPPDKNLGDADWLVENSAVAWDGNGVVFTMATGFGKPAGQIGLISTQYLSRRGAGGWGSRWLGEPHCTSDEESGIGAVDTNAVGVSPNLDRAIIRHPEGGSCPLPPLDPAAPLPAANFYLGDYRADPVVYSLVTPKPRFSPNYGSPVGLDFKAGSDDFTHLVYTSTGQQSTDAPAGAFEKLFEWHDGAVKLVSKDPTNTPFSTSSSAPTGTLNSVSADGNRIFFQNPTVGSGGACQASCELYMRFAGALTYRVSESECTSSCGSDAAAVFRWAAADGSRSLFTSTEKLVDEDISNAGQDLYLYTHTANPPADQNLTLLSGDQEPADGSGSSVLGVLGMSDDGKSVFFAADGQLLAGEPIGPGPKLYRWTHDDDTPRLEYLATLTGFDSINWFSPRSQSRAVTPSGAHLVIDTSVRLDRSSDHDSSRDVYRWDATQGWRCVSCQLPGELSAGDSVVQGTAFDDSPRKEFRTVISDDGRRVFFTSRDALVAADQNGDIQDVYQWHDGALSLISTGTGAKPAQLVGASRDGGDVFFTTEQRLVGWDTDDNADIYDSRVGGGFAEPPPAPVLCELNGGACEGRGTSSPPPATAASAAFAGPGNPVGGGVRNAKRRCAKAALRARKGVRVAARLRRAARRARGNPGRARDLLRRAARRQRAARRSSNRAKRCRRANRRAAR